MSHNLTVKCGAAGYFRVEVIDSTTGKPREDLTNKNVWTDLGLDTNLNCYAAESKVWPNRLLYGSGEQTGPRSQVETLAEQVGSAAIQFNAAAQPSEISISGNVLTFERTATVQIEPRGEDWSLKEVALSSGRNLTSTYSVLNPAVSIRAIDILIIHYTIRMTYPMELPAVPIYVEGLPPTTAKFKLKPTGEPGSTNFCGRGGSIASSANAGTVKAYTSESFQGSVNSGRDGIYAFFGINLANRENGFFGVDQHGANHIWVLDPPIVKNERQELRIGVQFVFERA